MLRTTLTACIVVGALAGAPAWSRAANLDKPHEYCGTNIPPDESTGFVPLLEGDVFCPLLADPKTAHSFVSKVYGSSTSALGTDLGSVGIGDRFGLVRWGGPAAGEGFQISLEGSVFAQFDLNTPSYDLINADYLVGVPLTYRWKDLSARVRLYHQSSHLGDEFVLRSRIPRENLSFEAAEVILSYDAGPLRVYGGGESTFDGEPRDVQTYVAHGGVELKQRGSGLRLGSAAAVRLVAAGDVKAVEDLDWKPAWSGRGGLEFSRGHESIHASRRWSLLGEYYEGPAPYGQFFHSKVKYYGAGIHFAI
jgi:hypothetical protein